MDDGNFEKAVFTDQVLVARILTAAVHILQTHKALCSLDPHYDCISPSRRVYCSQSCSFHFNPHYDFISPSRRVYCSQSCSFHFNPQGGTPNARGREVKDVLLPAQQKNIFGEETIHVYGKPSNGVGGWCAQSGLHPEIHQVFVSLIYVVFCSRKVA